MPQFSSSQELVEFFETHDMGEYKCALPEAHFEVDLRQNRYLVSVDGDLMDKLVAVAQAQQVSVEVLLDDWLKEKLLQAS